MKMSVIGAPRPKIDRLAAASMEALSCHHVQAMDMIPLRFTIRQHFMFGNGPGEGPRVRVRVGILSCRPPGCSEGISGMRSDSSILRGSNLQEHERPKVMLSPYELSAVVVSDAPGRHHRRHRAGAIAAS